ncbi:MAG: aspartate aminotransferase family protein [Acidobacteria bacterium]|nr:aspartate aminotransferase family protein [Acidobacteriota bacterium]
MKRTEYAAKQKEFLFPSVITYYKDPLPLARAKGQFVYDVDGKEYLDFYAGILTISVGHGNDYVSDRVCEQIKTLQHASSLYVYPATIELAEEMARITPGPLKKSFFTNSGTEANETAIVLARAYTGRDEIIALRHSYSGRSVLAMTLSGQSSWKVAGPAPGVIHAHNAYCYRCPFGRSYPSCGVACANDVEELIQTSTSGRVAALIAEPIQGAGGFIVPPPEYFEIAVGIVRKYGGLFISDEVQTGFGRTGRKMFGIEHWGVQPDIMTCAKGMGNGFPIGATVATEPVADALKGLTISTFGGNPVAASAARAVIEFIKKEQLLDKVEETGKYFRDRLNSLKEKFPLIGDVRGMGLMQGLELVSDRHTKAPAAKELAVLMEKTREKGLLVGKGGLYGNVVRLSPPLTIEKRDVDDAVRVLEEAFHEI